MANQIDHLKLIDEVYRSPSLWDKTNPAYRQSPISKRNTWKRIARELNEYDYKIVISKWTNLRNTYRQNLAKILSPKNGSDPQKKPKWELFEILDFLRPTIQTNKQTYGYNSPLTTSIDPSNYSFEDIGAPTYDPNSTNKSAGSTRTISKKNYSGNKRKSPEKSDECEIFGQLIATKLRRTDPSKRNSLQIEILKLIENYDEIS